MTFDILPTPLKDCYGNEILLSASSSCANGIDSVMTTSMSDISSTVGIFATVTFAWDLCSDFDNYQGSDVAIAGGTDTVGCLIGIGVGVAITGFGTPIGAAIIFGAIAGAGISMAADIAKKHFIKS